MERARIEVRVRIGSGPSRREFRIRGVRIAHDGVNTSGHIIVAVARTEAREVIAGPDRERGARLELCEQRNLPAAQ